MSENERRGDTPYAGVTRTWRPGFFIRAGYPIVGLILLAVWFDQSTPADWTSRCYAIVGILMFLPMLRWKITLSGDVFTIRGVLMTRRFNIRHGSKVEILTNRPGYRTPKQALWLDITSDYGVQRAMVGGYSEQSILEMARMIEAV